jgi:hypothetical protein
MSSSTMPRATLRQGIALPIALAAIVAVGALIAGVFFASTQEYRVGRNTLGAQRALQGAEVGLSSVLSSWTPARTTGLKVGFTDSLADTTIGEAVVKRRWTRVNVTTFWITSTSTAGSSLQGRAVKRLNAVMRIENPDFKIVGAVTTRNKVVATGSVTLNGNDTTVTGWDCPPAGAPGAGLVVNDSLANVSLSGGCTLAACITGTPKVEDSTSLAKDTMTYKNYGGFNFDSLAKIADKVLEVGKVPKDLGPKLDVNGACDRANVDNWGSINQTNPPSPCDEYYPVIYLKGDQDWILTGGGGQGIIVADGDLKVTGNFTWRGLIITRGVVKTVGSSGAADPGIKIIGAIMAMNKDNTDDTNLSGNSSVQFSRCVINQVSSRLSAAAVMKHRSWADLSF